MENKSKAQTLIGFCIKAGKCKIGTNAVATLKRAYLVIVCDSASDNAKDIALSYGKKFNCPVIKTQGVSLEQIVHKDNAKMMAISSKEFAKSITDYMENQFSILDGRI